MSDLDGAAYEVAVQAFFDANQEIKQCEACEGAGRHEDETMCSACDGGGFIAPKGWDPYASLIRAYLNARPVPATLVAWRSVTDDPPSAASERVGKWLSAALDDPGVCAEMKADISAWFQAGMPNAEPGREFEEVAARAWDFVAPKLVALNTEKGPAGVWSNGFRSGWTAAKEVATKN